MDISVTHMSHIETGNTKLSLPVLVALARVLEVRTDDLLTEPDSVTRDSILEEIASVLDSCTAAQARVIADLVKAAKISMDKHL